MSNETKWTKGPWEADPDHDMAMTVCLVGDVRVGTDEVPGTKLDDAHLIAAAPELYEALEWAMRFVEQVRAESPAPKGGGEDIAYREARAALAKARGES